MIRGARGLLLAAALAGCAEPGAETLQPRPVQGPPPLPDPGTAADPVERGNQYLAARLPERALEAFAEGVIRNPKDPAAMSGLGIASLRLGRIGEAERYLTQATVIAPESTMAWNNLGAFFYGQRRFAQARDALRTAFALDGGKTEAIRQNLALAEERVPETLSTDSVITEFRIVRQGADRYVLVDRTK